MSNQIKTTFAVAALAGALMLSSFTVGKAQVASNNNAAGNAPTQVLNGSFRVNFDAGAGSIRTDRILRIEFHDQYIVLMDVNNGGRVLPINSLRQFTWEPG